MKEAYTEKSIEEAYTGKCIEGSLHKEERLNKFGQDLDEKENKKCVTFGRVAGEGAGRIREEKDSLRLHKEVYYM